MKKFSIIICGYNEEDNLDLCIKSCLEQEYAKDQYEIIYVDNNSKDRSLEIAKKYPIKILSEKRQGLSEARNCGIKSANADILVFLDADLKLDSKYLHFHEKTFLDPKVGAGGGKVLPLISTWISNYLGVSILESYPRYLKPKLVTTYPGCNLTIRKKILEEVGLFAEGLKTAEGVTRFSEDKEICTRIRRAGFTISYNPEAIVWHENTYTLKRLIEILWKGGKSRLSQLREQKSTLNSLFRWNIPILATTVLVITALISTKIGFLIFTLYGVIFFILSTRAFLLTGQFFVSYLIKPVLDPCSLLLVNLAIIYYRL